MKPLKKGYILESNKLLDILDKDHLSSNQHLLKTLRVWGSGNHINNRKNYNYEDEQGIFTNTYTVLKSGEDILVACYDWNNKTENEKNWVDHLRVALNSKEFAYWINFIEN